MQNRTYRYFKKKGNNFSFPRFSIKDDGQLLFNYLDTVIELIEESIKSKNYMILSPDTLHSFLNSYIETLLISQENWEKCEQNLKKFARIYRIFKTKSSIILDEIDMTMDPKRQLRKLNLTA